MVHDLTSHETFISRNVHFYEKIFLYNSAQEIPPTQSPDTMIKTIFQPMSNQLNHPNIFPPPHQLDITKLEPEPQTSPTHSEPP